MPPYLARKSLDAAASAQPIAPSVGIADLLCAQPMAAVYLASLPEEEFLGWCRIAHQVLRQRAQEHERVTVVAIREMRRSGAAMECDLLRSLPFPKVLRAGAAGWCPKSENYYSKGSKE